jgi:hypothetical protein
VVNSILLPSFIQQSLTAGWCEGLFGSSFTPPKAARGSPAAHHAQRMALVGCGPAAQVEVCFFSRFIYFALYFEQIFLFKQNSKFEQI